MPSTAPEFRVMEVVSVVVGILRDGQGRVLITQRPNHAHQGGLWEFPGGKVELNETAQAALGRELREELGIAVLAAQPWIQVQHAYPDKTVLLDVWRIDAYAGQPRGLEGQPLVWLPPEQLSERAFPAADRPIIAALLG